MTRPSKREVENRIGDLADDVTPDEETGGRARIVHAGPETGEWHDDPDLTEGPIEKANADPVMVTEEMTVETDWEPDS